MSDELASHPGEDAAGGPAADTPGAPVRIGRPPLDPANPPGVPSPVWHVRAPRRLDEAARNRASHEGRDLSTIVRDAVEAYLCGAPQTRRSSQAQSLDGGGS